jgi:hypothetical protein
MSFSEKGNSGDPALSKPGYTIIFQNSPVAFNMSMVASSCIKVSAPVRRQSTIKPRACIRSYIHTNLSNVTLQALPRSSTSRIDTAHEVASLGPSAPITTRGLLGSFALSHASRNGRLQERAANNWITIVALAQTSVIFSCSSSSSSTVYSCSHAVLAYGMQWNHGSNPKPTREEAVTVPVEALME